MQCKVELQRKRDSAWLKMNQIKRKAIRLIQKTLDANEDKKKRKRHQASTVKLVDK